VQKNPKADLSSEHHPAGSRSSGSLLPLERRAPSQLQPWRPSLGLQRWESPPGDKAPLPPCLPWTGSESDGQVCLGSCGRLVGTGEHAANPDGRWRASSPRSQNPRMVGLGRDLCGSPSPAPLGQDPSRDVGSVKVKSVSVGKSSFSDGPWCVWGLEGGRGR